MVIICYRLSLSSLSTIGPYNILITSLVGFIGAISSVVALLLHVTICFGCGLFCICVTRIFLLCAAIIICSFVSLCCLGGTFYVVGGLCLCMAFFHKFLSSWISCHSVDHTSLIIFHIPTCIAVLIWFLSYILGIFWLFIGIGELQLVWPTDDVHICMFYHSVMDLQVLMFYGYCRPYMYNRRLFDIIIFFVILDCCSFKMLMFSSLLS